MKLTEEHKVLTQQKAVGRVEAAAAVEAAAVEATVLSSRSSSRSSNSTVLGRYKK